MKRIKEFIENRNIDTTKKMLNEEIELIERKIDILNNHKESLRKRLSSIDRCLEHTTFNRIELLYMNERKAITSDSKVPLDENADYLIQKLSEKFDDKFHVLGNSNFGGVFDSDSISKGFYNIYKHTFCLLEDDATDYNFILDEGYYVTYTYRGDYKQYSQIFDMLYRFVDANNYTILRDPIEIYKIDVYETSLEDEYVTQVQIPVKIPL